jgi:hypothetical protein
MDFPGINTLFFPFLNAIKDGQTYDRERIAQRMSTQLQLSDEQLRMTTKNGVPLLKHRLALCEGLLVKAGFVFREKNDAAESVTFTISPLGFRQLQRKSDDLTLGYIQTFYTGKVYRGSGSSDTTSTVELDLFDEFSKLPDPYKVFHSVSWIAHDSRYGSVGEADFIIAHPQYGILVIEVKGGHITLERQGNHQRWLSRNYHGVQNDIGDPIAQAERNRRNLRAWLANDRRTQYLNFAIFPAVAFPDMVVEQDIRPDCPKDIVIDANRVKNPEKTMREIFQYWHSRADRKNESMSGQAAVDALVEMLIPSRKLGDSVSVIFERERRKIEALTRRQFHILSTLQNFRRAAIVGGAGTGKTMLAMEKAKQLAIAGFRVLFLAYNRNITEWIKRTLAEENITVATFHSFVAQALRWADIHRPADERSDEFYQEAPNLLMDAARQLRDDNYELLFDAIIVDEAQDFDDTWWIALTDVLKSQENGILYVFFDDNQRLYQEMSNIPIETPPLHLIENCRNTQSIHTAMLPYAVDLVDSFCEGPEGRPVRNIEADTPEAQRRELRRLFHTLVAENGIETDEIVVLTPVAEKNSQWKTGEMLGNFVITWELDTNLSNAIRVSTIHGFKGLETSIVILTELHKNRHDSTLNQLLYVGLSRARHDVYIIGLLPKPI